MPIIIGTLTTPTPEPEPEPTPSTPTPVDTRGRRTAIYIAPDGTEWPLTSPGQTWRTLNAVSGLGAAPISIVADPHPRGGSRVRHIQPQSRTITWPLRFRASTHLELTEGWRRFGSALTQTRRLGPGRLRVMRPDGSAREIEVYYQAGYDGQPGEGWLWDTAVVQWYCEDPYWRAVSAISTPFEYSGTPVSYLDPYLTVSPTSVLGETTATNPGDAESWPTWTITGPASGLVATNNTTGESFALDTNWAGGGDLLAGETITITTDPPGVRGPAGEVWTGALDWPGAVLWGLQPGVNEINLAVSGAGNSTSIVLSYTPRYETA